MKLFYSIALTVVILLQQGFAVVAISTTQNNDQQPNDEDQVKISPECAAALLATTAALGAGATYALTPAVMCTAGFCPTGVAGSSFASWWQSTMPLVKSGSLFAQLQSLAMGGAGMGKVTIAAGAVGGITGLGYLKKFCAIVDDADPNTAAGKAIALTVATGRGIVSSQEYIMEQCSSSETCTAAMMATWEAAASASQLAREKMNEAKELLETQCASSELCLAGIEAGKTVQNFASNLWRSVIKGDEAEEEKKK